MSATKKPEHYKTPPKKAFRAMGLGKLVDGHCKVVAGFRYAWWDPFGHIIPLTVNARVLRIRSLVDATQFRGGK